MRTYLFTLFQYNCDLAITKYFWAVFAFFCCNIRDILTAYLFRSCFNYSMTQNVYIHGYMCCPKQ